MIFPYFILYFQDVEPHINGVIAIEGGKMDFIEPDWLYLLIVPAVLMPLLAIIGNVRRSRRLSALLGAGANSPEAVHLSRGRRVLRCILLCTAVFFIVIACGRPSFYAKLLPFEEKGRDLLVLCDVSRSMNASDIAPSRLRHAQFLLHQLAARDRGDRLGLVLFAGNAYLSCPLTSDPVTFNEYVDDISTDSVPAGGTNLERALQVALKAFESSESGNRAIILLTDGEELQGNIKAAAAELAKRRIPVFAIGFGDPVNGAVIPKVPGESALIRDKNGKIVTTKLNEKLLSSLASLTKGIYIRTTATDSGFPQLQSAIDGLDRLSRENVKHKLPVEEFPKALAAALAALLLFLLLSERKSPAPRPLILLLAFSLSLSDLAGAEKKELPTLEGKGKEKSSPAPAVTVEPKTPEGIYNLAREMQISGKKDYVELYRKVISLLPADSPLRARSFLNLGAGLHNDSRALQKNIGEQLKQQRPAEALQTIKESLSLSEGAEEMYSASVSGGAVPEELLGKNLTILFKERKALEELKKKIEELLKQQQKAQKQTASAQQQNKPKPQNQQQRQEQQRAIEQAQQASQQLRQQAQQLKQSQLSQSAQKAARELQKAAEAKKKGQDQQSSRHLEKALKELAGNGGEPRKKDPSSQEPKGTPDPARKKTQQNAQQIPRPGNMQKQPDRKGAEQMLEMMGEDDKKMRDAIKARQRLRRPQTERDW